ncbi:MAG TPA: hypothetical protein VJL84_10250 [Kiloniellales bacterium]|nr:hypothetical protein [Kiloniellales bacterium]
MWHDWRRRTLLRGSFALAIGSVLPKPLRADRQPTPAMTEGPFYPEELPAESDPDLLRVADQTAPAQGEPLHLFVLVEDVNGVPLAGTLVEIWQCDANGVYRHPSAGGQRDSGFQGYGRLFTDEEGIGHFRTIRPVAYAGRAPHVHVKVETLDGRRLTTQMFVAEEPLNERDGLYRSLGEAAPLVTVPLSPVDYEPPGLGCSFFIVLPEA